MLVTDPESRVSIERTIQQGERGIMRRSPIRTAFFEILAITFLMNLFALGQSLGEVARKNREKQKAADGSSSTLRRR